MVSITDVALAPWKAGRLLVRAADDLNAVAERARRDPDPVEEVRERLDALLGEIARLTELVVPLPGVLSGLAVVAERVDATGRRIVTGGQDLVAVGARLDGHAVELIDGGADLTAVSRELADTLAVFRAVLPRLLDGLDTVEHLEDAVESVAETVEPLAGAAESVGRFTKRLSRRGRDDLARPAS